MRSGRVMSGVGSGIVEVNMILILRCSACLHFTPHCTVSIRFNIMKKMIRAQAGVV